MNLLTYPARPRKGGPFNLAIEAGAYSDIDAWAVEPKLNGWRVVVDTTNGAAFNRHGLRLSIDFPEAMDKLCRLPFPLLDCEGLDRRHNVGRGSLVVLDFISDNEGWTYEYRRSLITDYLPLLDDRSIPVGSVYLVPSYPASDGVRINNQLKQRNAELGCTFYEGLVAKRLDSAYPTQNYSPEQEFPGWVKHRFTSQ